MKCDLCFHECNLEEGQTGLCKARENRFGVIVSKNYGQITSLALDPIEKKPLKHFYPGSLILSIGSYGCNLKCPFCQNHEISCDNGKEVQIVMTPEDLIDSAVAFKGRGNIGIAFTYNEPLISFEYVLDCFKVAKENNLKTVLVTNGTINKKYLLRLLPYVDAMNIDLKGFREEIYETLGGSLETVKETIELASRSTHVEITSLIVPGLNDSKEDMKKESEWIASIDREIPLHITRFFPTHMYQDKSPTDIGLLKELADIANITLTNVYLGNV